MFRVASSRAQDRSLREMAVKAPIRVLDEAAGSRPEVEEYIVDTSSVEVCIWKLGLPSVLWIRIRWFPMLKA
jgi:hypothetical protein